MLHIILIAFPAGACVCVCGPNEKSQNIKNVPATTTTQMTKITRITGIAQEKSKLTGAAICCQHKINKIK